MDVKRASGNTTINLSSEKLRQKYSEATLKCSAYHIRRSGLDLKSSHLKIDKHYLSVVPYTMSLDTCRFLVSMNKQEISLFESFKDNTQSLKLTFDSDIFGQVVDFLLWGRIVEIRQANPVLNIVLVTFRISRIANAYREIFIDCVMDNERLESFYQNEDFGGRLFDSECVREIFGTNTAMVSCGSARPAPFKIDRLSLKHVRIFGPSDHEEFNPDELVKINLVDDHPPLVLNGRITGMEDSREIEGYHFVDVETDFCPYLTEIMSPFLDGS
jgi:hypothetical protein